MLDRSVVAVALSLFLGFLAPAASGQSRPKEYVVIVNPACGVKSVSSKKLEQIFKRELQYWSVGKGRKTKINLVLPKSKTASMEVARKKVYRMSEKELKQYWVKLLYQNKIARRPKRFPSAKLLVRLVAKGKGAISIVELGDAKGVTGVRILKIDGKSPGDKGYGLVASDAHAPDHDVAVRPTIEFSPTTNARDGESSRVADAAFDPAVDPLGDPTGDPAAQEHSDDSPQDTDEESRIDRLEADLLDLQIAMLGEEDDVDPYEDGPLLTLNGFGHFAFGVDDGDDGVDQGNQFALGGLDLFITSQLSENLSFLTETVFEPTEEGEYVLDVERVILKYTVSDALNVSAGRLHTTLGYWNQEYHHGEWLQTSIGRPSVLNFEDEDGLLPVHMVGLAFKGRVGVEDTPLEWALEVGNGRGAEPDPPQVITDLNEAKAVNFNLAISPAAVTGLRFGIGTYFDDIPAGAGHGQIDELILSGYATYHNAGWEILTEFFDIDHDAEGAGKSSSHGYYAQAGHRFGDWMPYARYDVARLDDNDVFFANTDDTETISGGIRWDWQAWSALKLQYNLVNTSPAAGGSDVNTSRLELQLSFAF